MEILMPLQFYYVLTIIDIYTIFIDFPLTATIGMQGEIVHAEFL